ncbi:BT_3928 family protein [Robiginitalea sp. IMCC44478]|uniref:BT_3928 family protein n=1 Tax=Robiginitalea sp. IMCC44478 TaxID=3459122 RepID=UPI004042E121
MKILIWFLRLFVGILFIISGLIKLNDPVGFSFKLEEYFSAAVLNIPFLEPYALAIALFVVILEVVLGVALLVGFRRSLTLWTLLGMIVFFTFLTFYSAYFNKVTDCGCFGDAVKLTPWESFTKDVVLLGAILLLFWGRQHLTPLGSGKFRLGITLASVLACILFANQVLNHLPSMDFRPYHIGANIPRGMEIPEDAPKPVFEYDWRFRINGEEEVITTNGAYPEVEGEFVGLDGTREIQPGYEPPIHDFTIEKEGIDLASGILKRKNLLMVIAYDLNKSEPKAFEDLKTIIDSATSKGYSVIGMSASSQEQTEALNQQYGMSFPWYFTDQTTLKTIVRSNPGVLLLQEGTIVQKLHYNDLDQLELQELPAEERYLQALKKNLDSILERDQLYRGNLTPENMGKQYQIDQQNIVYIDSIISEYGYPGTSLVGPNTDRAAWYVIQHSERIDEFLPQIKIAAETGELPFRLYAMMLDRSLMNQGLPQQYGTQAMTYFWNTPEEINLIWPIEDHENVNQRRKAAGFTQTIEEYAGEILDGEDYRVYTMEELKEIQERQKQATQ